MSPSTCGIGFWIGELIGPDTKFPIPLRKSLRWKLPPINSNQTKAKPINRNVVSIVEIWSKNPRIEMKNRLIATQIKHHNIYIDPDSPSSEWFYGGKTAERRAYVSNEILKRRKDISKAAMRKSIARERINEFQYKYRWHIKSMAGLRDDDDLMNELSLLNITKEGCTQGYKGEDCNVPICLEGCDADHGFVLSDSFAN